MMKKFVLIILVVLIAGLMIFGGCAAPTPTPAPTPTLAKQGGVYIFNYSLPADRFGVPQNIIHYNHVYARFCLETLLQASDEKANTWEPYLAESWELAPDKSYYIFHLRKDVKFHDGTDFNAQAVKWNLDRWLDIQTPTLEKVSSIDIIDNYTIRVNLKAWDTLLLDDFTRPTFIISPTAFEKNGEQWANENPIGTGPFKLKEFKRNQMVAYERNENYWNKGLPYLDRIEILQAPDPMTGIAMIKAGEVDALYQVDPLTANELTATGDYLIDQFPGLHLVIVMNTTDPGSAWSDKRMREALEYAIDKEIITKSLGFGFTKPVYEIIHSIYDSGGKPNTTPRKYDPEKAKQLMAEAGYSEGVNVTLTVSAFQPQDFYVALQGSLAKAGINVTLDPVSDVALNQMSFEPAKGSDLSVQAQRGGVLSPLSNTKETLSSRSVYFPGLKRPEGFDSLLEQALAETDANKIMNLLENMEELAYNDAMFVPLWTMPILTVYQGGINDVIWAQGGNPFPRFDWAWLSTK